MSLVRDSTRTYQGHFNQNMIDSARFYNEGPAQQTRAISEISILYLFSYFQFDFS